MASNWTGTGGRLLPDFAVGQRFLQFGDARVGDLGAAEIEAFQTGQPREMHQSRVGDLGVVEPEIPQVGQTLEMHQPASLIWV